MHNKKTKNKNILIAVLVVMGILFFILLIRMFVSPSIPQLAKITRGENATPCTTPTHKDQIYYGGSGADYISDGNGRNISKIWDKQSLGIAFGIPSPDGSRIAYVEDDGLWIRCIANEGLIKIDFPHKTIDNGDYPPRLLIKGVSWSPDSQKLVLNYAGDVIRVDAKTKEKQVIVKDAAFKTFRLVRPSSPPNYPTPASPWYYDFNQGTTFWATNGDIFYTKFTDPHKMELRKIMADSGKDEVVITGDFPVDINNVSPDQKYILMSDYPWKDQRDENPYYNPNYAIDLSNKQTMYELYNQPLTNESVGILPKKVRWAKDGKFAYIGDDGNSPVNSNAAMIVIDFSTGKNKNLTPAIKSYLKNILVSSLEFYGFSSDNTMLVCVNCEDYQSERKVLLIDQNGDISEIYEDSKVKPGTPQYLWPKSWL